MALVRWEPARELSSLQSEMNRLFTTFFDAPAETGGARRWTPPMDLVETEEGYVLKADLPGIADGDVSVEVEGGVLTISGERRAEHEARKEGYVRVERAYGAFRRSVTLPDGIDPADLHAEFDKGVLSIRIPKPALPQAHKVQIAVGGAPADVDGTVSDTPAEAPEAAAEKVPVTA